MQSSIAQKIKCNCTVFWKASQGSLKFQPTSIKILGFVLLYLELSQDISLIWSIMLFQSNTSRARSSNDPTAGCFLRRWSLTQRHSMSSIIHIASLNQADQVKHQLNSTRLPVYKLCLCLPICFLWYHFHNRHSVTCSGCHSYRPFEFHFLSLLNILQCRRIASSTQSS